MLQLADPRPQPQDTWFVVLGVDGNLEHRVYYQPEDGFLPGNRAEIVERNAGADRWLFQEPANPDSFRYADLLLTGEINYGGVTYTAKGSTLYGEATLAPAPSGLESPLFASVTEYAATTECDNPEILVMELGGVDPDDATPSDEGGLIRVLLGSRIEPNDFDVLPR